MDMDAFTRQIQIRAAKQRHFHAGSTLHSRYSIRTGAVVAA